MRKKRRGHVRIRWSRVLGLLLAANVACGLAFSPVTSASTVRAVGVAANDRPRVYRLLQRLKGIPCLRVDAEAIESLMMADSALKTARLSQNIFRQAVFEVEYLQPVASIAGHSGLALSAEGIVFRAKAPTAGLAEIQLPVHSSRPVFSYCSGWESQTLASIAERVSRDKALRNMSVEVYSNGLVCLNNREGARVVLGPTERLEEKFDKLHELLQEQPDLLIRAKEVNLVSPSRPVARFRDLNDMP